MEISRNADEHEIGRQQQIAPRLRADVKRD